MKKLLLLLFLIPNLVMADYFCHKELETKDLRKDYLNFIINTLEEKYISQIEIPPPHEIKKMDARVLMDEESFRESYNNKFYPAYEVQKKFSKVKETSSYSSSEMLNLLKLSMNMHEVRDALFHYKERNSTSDLKIRDIAYSFTIWNGMIIDMGECAVK